MGQNKTRLQQNNTDLQSIKTTVENLPDLPTPQVVTIDGVQQSGNLTFESKGAVVPLPEMESSNKMIEGSAVVLNDEIHVLGYKDGTYSVGKNHYKWNGSSWTSVSTLPIYFGGGSAVVLNNEIHILGGAAYGSSDYTNNHYKWNGSSWTSVSTLPYYFAYGSAVVLNNEIHILGNGINHYKWNGSSWTSVSTLPYSFGSGSAVVLNNEIHILGGSSYSTYHYKWNGSSWSSVSTLPVGNRGQYKVISSQNTIFYYSGYSNASMNRYKYENGVWTLEIKYVAYAGNSCVPAVVRIGIDDYILGAFWSRDFRKVTKLYALAS